MAKGGSGDVLERYSHCNIGARIFLQNQAAMLGMDGYMD